MTPGAQALALVAPIATPLVAGAAALFAIRTFYLRIRVDHADQWWKRVQYALDKNLSGETEESIVGMELIDSLIEPPEDTRRKEKLDHKKSLKQRPKLKWKVSRIEPSYFSVLLKDSLSKSLKNLLITI